MNASLLLLCFTDFQVLENGRRPNQFLIPKYFQHAFRLTEFYGDCASFDSADYKEDDNAGVTALELRMKERKQAVEHAISVGLHRARRVEKGSVGQGFIIASSRSQFLALETRLEGKWGSYKMFEK